MGIMDKVKALLGQHPDQSRGLSARPATRSMPEQIQSTRNRSRYGPEQGRRIHRSLQGSICSRAEVNASVIGRIRPDTSRGLALASVSSCVVLAMAPAADRPLQHSTTAHSATGTLGHCNSATPRPVSRSPVTPYSVTIAARECPGYGDIMANRARERHPGIVAGSRPDTAYVGGQQIDPDVEQANDVNCTPLNGAVFSFGDGTASRARPSIGGSSGVIRRRPGSLPVPTANCVPRLDAQGQPRARTWRATTFALNETQIDLASRSSSLWLQGGTVGAPLPAHGVGGQTLAFGALRCAIDNLNGDNVEWVGFPSVAGQGSHHVFCYAYYVSVAPPQGSITIVKRLSPGAGTISQGFTFASNATYNPPAPSR